MTGAEIFIIIAGFVVGFLVISVFVRSRPSGVDPRDAQGAQGDRPGSHEPEEVPSQPQPPRAWFDVLEVEEAATEEDIAAAYRRQMGRYHPDKAANLGRDIRELAEARAKEINAAYAEARRRQR
jgi:DnaJ-domain-containing protein 1